MKLLGKYVNGNVYTTIFNDGTKIRETQDNEFEPDFAENMDIKICDRCDMGCKWCHEGSTLDGAVADIMNEKFIDTLHPYQEVALGGGNVLEHPNLIDFLYRLRNNKIITNITVNQVHFEKNIKLLDILVREKLIYGLGVSLVSPTEDFIKNIQFFPNAVVHIINGIVTEHQINMMKDKDIKILILGYKTLRRGNDYHKNEEININKKMNWLEENLADLISHFQVVSFDNLAIEQLNVKKLLSDKQWEDFYAGDDGSNTFYIDMVKRQFARSSTAPFEKRYELLDSVDDMFKAIREEIKDEF